MPDSRDTLTVRVASSIDEIEAAAWDRCAGTANPFVSHAFLTALEASGAASARAGWQPLHLVCEVPCHGVIGVVPAYAKGHSFGEYVFDHAWADAWERAGGSYYPKLQVAVPFTPVTGPRLLIRPDAGLTPAQLRHVLIRTLERVGDENRLSSVHVTFPDEEDWEAFGHAGWLRRTGQQFHWENRGYEDFEAFLASLTARKRKAIRRERRAVADSGVRIHALTGADLKPEHWDAFHSFYMDTGGRKWGFPYLNLDFFHRLGATMADRVVLFLVEEDGRWVAGALNLLGDRTLYGRNWGAIVDRPFLHFETCYYQAIEFAIVHRLDRVEAGAQGEHKLQRGYLPTRTFSAHYVRHPAFRRVLAEHLDDERAWVDEAIESLSEASPFRRDGGGGCPGAG